MPSTGSLGDTIGGWRGRRTFDGIEAFCLFVGYPRSGHSLIGALLNAHPDMVIAHELDAIKLAATAGYSRNRLCAAIMDRDRWWKDRDWQWEGWDYRIESPWQGRVRDLKVVGDKAGGLVSRQVHRDPSVLDSLAETVRAALRLIHHVRNPYDTISTMARKGQPGVDSLDAAIDRYFGEHAPGVAITMEWARNTLLSVEHEAFIGDPAETLKQLCAHLGQDVDEPYLAACAAHVHPSPRKSRTRIEWTPAQIERVRRLAEPFPWLRSYSYES